ncbi:hypothetical protein BV22DRAFT_1027471 [Leucogyrophana mollusca]|uniref:Uncharacterized protein n=1 Tax=Leucogyrophana mollusca TaxID=85980 RepID=A0ACB8C091_9AGAM|nr:hypothetical protein BV22DRAFT_1027471 [Leucogyrophana mollusca]
MPTSELSDALNPYYAQSRSRSTNNSVFPENTQRQTQHSQQYAPHRSELELAVSEPPQPPAAPPTPPSHPAALPRSHSSGGVQAVQELLRFLASTKEAHEIERKRRLAWEQEQEAKYTLRHAEMERRMLEMRQEITSLRSRIHINSANSASPVAVPNQVTLQQPTPQFSMIEQQPTPTTSPALSHTSTTSHYPSSAINVAQSAIASSSNSFPRISLPLTDSHPAPTPATSPPARFISVDPSSSGPASRANSRKRQTMHATSDEDGSSDSNSSSSSRLHPSKRKSHHDSRCLTIQHAMRIHILRTMQLETDKDLPNSHIEGTALAPDEPVRFVWDKTPKQSVHNGRMKTRVLKDLKTNRHLYKHVPDKDFSKKSLESVFDQAFVTFRQKFKAQRDASISLTRKQKEDTKAMKARRLSRRKIKLSNRSDIRNKIVAFEHVTFDGALQLECMSSEESEVDESASSRCTFLRTRGFAWRSNRMQRFFDALDEEERLDHAQKPKRGVGRKERFVGALKDGILLPPKGVASWMISKRWISMMQTSHPEVLGMLKDIVVDPAGFDWDQFHALGEESEDEGRLDMGHLHAQDPLHYNLSPEIASSSISSSSLLNALAHVP